MGEVVHFEIPFDDKSRAKEFYKKIFGWNFTEIPEMKYLIANTTEVDEQQMPKEPGSINGGMYDRKDGGSKNPVIVINVDEIDKKLEEIKKAGGEIFLEKRQVGNMGLYSQVKDTEGNIIGVWQNLKKN